MLNHRFAVLVVAAMAWSAAPEMPLLAAIPLASADVNRDCVVTTADATLARASLGKKRGQPGYNAAADVNGDGVINNTDLTFITRNIGKTVCTTVARPVVAITAPKAGLLTNALSPTVTGTVSDPAITSGVLRVNGVNQTLVITKGTFSQSVTLAEGINRLQASATNAAGTGTSNDVALTVDTQPPSLMAMVPDTARPGTTVALSVMASDVNGVTAINLMVDGAPAGTHGASPAEFSFPVASDAAAGNVRALEVRATDRAGNVATVRDAVIVEGTRDTLPPTVLLQVPGEATAGELIPVIVSAQDDGLLLQLSMAHNGKVLKHVEATPFAAQHSFTIPAGATEGQVFEFVAQGIDSANNIGAATASVTIVPKTAPTTELLLNVNQPPTPTFLPSTVLTGTIGSQAGTLERNPTPFIASLGTTEGRQGQQLDIVITGANTHFENGLSSAVFGAGITVESVVAQSPTELLARISVAADAGLGPRLVAVSTGTEEAFLVNAFNVRSGVGTLNGRLVNAQGGGIADAQVCVPGAALCVLTDSNGNFTLLDVPTIATRYVITAPGFESGGGALALKLGETAALGSIPLSASTDIPPPPPPAGAPAIAPALAVVFGRGVTLVQEGGDPEKLRKLVIDTIVAVGGTEIGVLDANGNQLNVAILDNGFSSVLDRGARDIAEGLAGAEFTTLGELLTSCFMSLQYQGATPPSLLRILDSLQLTVNQAWINPNAVSSPLLMALFNQGRAISAQPPRLSADTPLNALQSYLLVTTWFAFLNRHLPANTDSTPPPAASLEHATAARGFLARIGDAARTVGSLLRPAMANSSLRATGVHRTGMTALSRTRSLGPAMSRATRSSLQPADRWPSLMWEEVLVKSKNTLPDHIRNGSVQLCNATQGTPGEPPPLMTVPGCSEAVRLVEMLFSSQADPMREASTRFTSFMTTSTNATDAARMRRLYQDQSFQDAWRASREQARTFGRAQAFANFSSEVMQGLLAKQIGDITNLILNLEVELIVESLRPQPPTISNVEQLRDEQGRPALKVKVTFNRSLNDRGNEASDDEHEEHWFYELWRAGGGVPSVKVASSRFLGQGDSRTLSFVDDLALTEGGYSYQVVAVRIVGRLVLEGEPPNDIDIFMGWLSGIGLAPSLDFSTPGMSFEVPGGFNGSRQVQIGGVGSGALQTVLNPVAKIFNGVRRQESPRSDAQGVFVSSRPPQPPPPASLAVDGLHNNVFLSIPVSRNIFTITTDGVTSFVDTNFAFPNQTGLAIDSYGSLYSGNAASEAKFGGRVFRFQQPDGRRDHIGNVNYYSFLLQFAHPSSMQSLAVGPAPFGEALYVADGYSGAIKRMFLPHTAPPGVEPTRNIAQIFAQSNQFAFGPTTTLAFRGDGQLFVNQASDIFRISTAGVVSSLFADVDVGDRPFVDIGGIAFDVFQNLYVADRPTGTITMIPAHQNLSGNALFGVSRIDLKKLTVTRGLRSPSEVKLAPDERGLVFFDKERAVVFLPFGVSGQIVDGNGQPIVGAEVLVRDRGKATVTDGDGVYVLPGLLSAGLNSAVDLVVRFDGRTQTFRAFLDARRHNIADFTFDPPAPPPPAEIPPPPPVPPPPPPPIEEDVDDETVSFPALRVHLPHLAPVTPPPPPTPDNAVCPRAYFMRPGHRTATMSSPLGVSGLVTDPSITTGFIVVNGLAQTTSFSGGSFNEMVVLRAGDNMLAFALSGRAAKDTGCVPQDTPDDAIVPISTTVNVFHDPSADVVRAARLQRGFDVAVVGRVIDDETGVPVTGITLGIPDTEIEAETDSDGVFQLNVPLGGVNFATETPIGQPIASLDAIAAFEMAEQGNVLGNIGGVLGGLKGTVANLIRQLQINGILQTGIVGSILGPLEKSTVLSDLQGISGLVATLLADNPHPVLQTDLNILGRISQLIGPKVASDLDPPRAEEEELQDQIKAIQQQQAAAFEQIHSMLECMKKSINSLLGNLHVEGPAQRVGVVASRLPLEAALERNPAMLDAALEPCTTRGELLDAVSSALAKETEARDSIVDTVARATERVLSTTRSVMTELLARLEAGADPTAADLTQITGLFKASEARRPSGLFGGLLSSLGGSVRIGGLLSGLLGRQEGALSEIGHLLRNFSNQMPDAFLTPNLLSSISAIQGNSSGLLGRLLKDIDKTPQDTQQLRALFEGLQTLMADLNKIMVQVHGTTTQLMLNMNTR